MEFKGYFCDPFKAMSLKRPLKVIPLALQGGRSKILGSSNSRHNHREVVFLPLGRGLLIIKIFKKENPLLFFHDLVVVIRDISV